jgi:hypothetical protein
MTTSPHFKPETCAVVLIDHQVGTPRPYEETRNDGYTEFRDPGR